MSLATESHQRETCHGKLASTFGKRERRTIKGWRTTRVGRGRGGDWCSGIHMTRKKGTPPRKKKIPKFVNGKIFSQRGGRSKGNETPGQTFLEETIFHHA